MLTVFEIVFALSAVISSLFFVLIYNGWRRAVQTPPGRTPGESVTVVVAAHNEARHLPALLTALREQSLPREQLHIIVVDDRSTDSTRDILEEHGSGLNLHIHHVDAVPEGVSPKKYALHHGISAAATDIVLLTDADCEPESDWAASMLRVFDSGNDVVVGLAPLRGEHAAAGRYGAFESRRTMATMSAAAAWKRPYMATGRSWGFRKSLYKKVGGLEALYAQLGGDDDLLLQRLSAAEATVGVCTEPGSFVYSDAPQAWSTLFRQKLRHYSVSSSYRGAAAILLGLFVATELLVPISAVALMLILPGWQKLIPPLFWIWKLWYDSGFLVAAFKWMRGETGRLTLAKWEAFHIFHAVFVGILSYLKRPRW